MRRNNENALEAKRLAVSLFSAAALFMAAPAIAAGSGGGTGLPATPSGPQIDPAQSYQEGLEALQAGDYKTAEKRFNEVLTVARKMPEANYYMGITKVRLGKEKSSVRYFKRAIKALPNFVEAREQLALVQISIGKADDAAEQLEALKEIEADCSANGCEDVIIARTAQAITTVEAALGAGGEEVSAAPADNQFAQLIFAPRRRGRRSVCRRCQTDQSGALRGRHWRSQGRAKNCWPASGYFELFGFCTP